MMRKRSGISPTCGEVEHPRQQLALGQVAGRPEEDDHLVVGDRGRRSDRRRLSGLDAHADSLTDGPIGRPATSIASCP